MKGLEPVREAGRILREGQWPDLEYLGFVEGDDIGMGKADVVVTEGFAGNIALKTAEGTARQIGEYLRRAMTPFAQRTHRIFVRALGVPPVAGTHRSAPVQWRRFSRPQRHRHQKPWRHRRRRLCGGHRARLRRRARSTPGARSPQRSDDRAGSRSRRWAEPLCDAPPFGCPRLRQLSAEPGPHQRRSGAEGRHVRRMDRAAHRHP